MKNRKTDPGFTLIEILIAMFIFGIIVTTIFGSFNAVFSTADDIDQGMVSYEMAKSCLDRMILDLRSIKVSSGVGYIKPTVGTDTQADPYRFIGDNSYADGGNFSRLRFTSHAHVGLENTVRDGIAEVVYYVQRTRDDTSDESSYVLRRADSLYPYKRFKDKTFEEDQSDPVLCEGIKLLEFKYYDDENTEYDRWDSESEEFKYATPRAIKIKLEFGDDSSSILFETMVSFPIYREKVS